MTYMRIQKIFDKLQQKCNITYREIKSRCTMKPIKGHVYDHIANRVIYEYFDCYGEVYLAEYPFNIFKERFRKRI